MRRWLAAWGLASLAVAAGGSYLVWRASVPVMPTGARIRLDKTHMVVIPHDNLMEHPVWLSVEMDMTPPIMAGPNDVFAHGLVYRACIRDVGDIARTRRKALAWAGEPRATVRRYVWKSISLDECLRRPWTSTALP